MASSDSDNDILVSTFSKGGAVVQRVERWTCDQ